MCAPRAAQLYKEELRSFLEHWTLIVFVRFVRIDVHDVYFETLLCQTVVESMNDFAPNRNVL